MRFHKRKGIMKKISVALNGLMHKLWLLENIIDRLRF